MSKNKVIIITIIASALVGAIVAYFKVGWGTKRIGAVESPPERVRVANIGIYSNYNVLADKLGFFKANGIDAVVDEYDSGATALAALASGKADIAVAADFVVARNIFDQPDIRILATAGRHDVWRLVTRTDRISGQTDLKGKRIGLTRNTAAEYNLVRFLTQNGLNTSDVEMIDLSASDIPGTITSGGVDAVMVFEPNASRLLQGQAQLSSWEMKGNRRTLTAVFTTSGFIADHPDAADSYVQALVDAEKYQTANGELAQRAFTEAMGYDDDTIGRLWPNFEFAVRLDQELLLTMEDQARWIIDNGIESGPVPNYLRVIHYTPLEKADPAAVTIIH